MERDNKARLYDLQHRMHCAALPLGDKPQEAWDQASTMLNKSIQVLMPWVKVTTKEDMRRQIVDNWAATYGDPNDPEVIERSRQTALALIREANAAIRKSMAG